MKDSHSVPSEAPAFGKNSNSEKVAPYTKRWTVEMLLLTIISANIALGLKIPHVKGHNAPKETQL